MPQRLSCWCCLFYKPHSHLTSSSDARSTGQIQGQPLQMYGNKGDRRAYGCPEGIPPILQ